MTDKTEEQIAKDKDAVARMAGAKTAMESALRRISLLEDRLKSIQGDCQAVRKAFSDSAYFSIWQNDNSGGKWAVRKASDIFNDIDNQIKSVL